MEYKRVTEKDWHKEKFYPTTDNERAIRKRLWDLENKIEQGKIIELPVKLTEKCYAIFGRNEKYIKEVCVIMYEIGTVDKWARVIWYEGERKLWEDFHVNELYPTREEAEKRLKELQE